MRRLISSALDVQNLDIKNKTITLEEVLFHFRIVKVTRGRNYILAQDKGPDSYDIVYDIAYISRANTVLGIISFRFGSTLKMKRK